MGLKESVHGTCGHHGFPDVQNHVLQSERLDHQDQSFGKGISRNQLGRNFGQQHTEMISNLFKFSGYMYKYTDYILYVYIIICKTYSAINHNPCRNPRGISHVSSRVFFLSVPQQMTYETSLLEGWGVEPWKCSKNHRLSVCSMLLTSISQTCFSQLNFRHWNFYISSYHHIFK